MSVPDLNRALMQRYLDGQLSPDEAAAFGRMLMENQEVARTFADLARLEALLEDHFVDSRGSADARPEGLVAFGSRRALSGSLAVAVAALAMMVLAGLLWSSRGSDEQAASLPVVAGQVLVNGAEAFALPLNSPFEVPPSAAATIGLGRSHARFQPATSGEFHGAPANPVIRLQHGGGRFQIVDKRFLRVETSAGAIEARDADFTVFIQPMTTEALPMNSSVLMLLTVAVAAGQVEVENNQQKVKVSAGEQRAFSKEKASLFAGEVTAVAPGGMRITLVSKSPKEGAPSQQREFELTDSTELLYFGVYRDGDRPTVGYRAAVLLDANQPERAVRIQFGAPVADLSGRVLAVSEDGASIEVSTYSKGDSPGRRTIEITDRTRVAYDGLPQGEGRPTVDQIADVWLEQDSNRAIEVRFRSNPKPNPKSASQPLNPPAKTAKPEGAPTPEKKAPDKQPGAAPEKKPLEKNPEGKPAAAVEKKPAEPKPEKQPAPEGEKKPGEKNPEAKPGAAVEKKPAEPKPEKQPAPAGEKKPGEKNPEAKPAAAVEKKPAESKPEKQPAPAGEKKPLEKNPEAKPGAAVEKQPGEKNPDAKPAPDSEKKKSN